MADKNEDEGPQNCNTNANESVNNSKIIVKDEARVVGLYQFL